MGIFNKKKQNYEMREVRRTSRELGIEIFETEMMRGFRNFPRENIGTILKKAKERALKRAREVV